MSDDFQLETGLVEAHSGWKRWDNDIDAEVARESKCPNPACQHVGLEFHGFKSRSVFVAIARCPICKHEFEF